jgi:hypothetical protein
MGRAENVWSANGIVGRTNKRKLARKSSEPATPAKSSQNPTKSYQPISININLVLHALLYAVQKYLGQQL